MPFAFRRVHAWRSQPARTQIKNRCLREPTEPYKPGSSPCWGHVGTRLDLYGMASRPRRVGDEIRARDPRVRVGWNLAEHVVSEEHLEILAHLRLRNPPLVHGASDHVGAGDGLAPLGGPVRAPCL